MDRLAYEATQGIETVVVPWPSLEQPRYAVTVGLRETGDTFDCVSLAVTALRPGAPVASAMLRDIPVLSVMRDAIGQLLAGRLASAERNLAYSPDTVTTYRHGSDGTTAVEAGAPDEEFERSRRAYWEGVRDRYRAQLAEATGEGNGRRYPPGHLERVAEVVREARKWREPVQKAVQDVFGLSRGAAASQIVRAKNRGLLDEEES